MSGQERKCRAHARSAHALGIIRWRGRVGEEPRLRFFDARGGGGSGAGLEGRTPCRAMNAPSLPCGTFRSGVSQRAASLCDIMRGKTRVMSLCDIIRPPKTFWPFYAK